MTENDRLMHALSDHVEPRKHIDIKFFRGTSDDVTSEQPCHQARSEIEQILSKLVEPIHPSMTLDVGYYQRSLTEFVTAL